MESDLKLLSLLQKQQFKQKQLNPYYYPSNQTIKLQKGVYGYTDDWKITDENNYGIFTKLFHFNREDLFGKIRLRTNEKRNYEEYKNNKKNFLIQKKVKMIKYYNYLSKKKSGFSFQKTNSKLDVTDNIREYSFDNLLEDIREATKVFRIRIQLIILLDQKTINYLLIGYFFI